MDIRPDRLRATLETLAQIGATPGGGVTRLALTDEDRAARDLLAGWMTDAGLGVRFDDAGNMYGRRAGSNSGATPLLFGSHLDSVIKGGRFDGALGVAAALEVIRTLNDHGAPTARPLELVNWTDEEGVRFQPSMLGSGVVSGRFPPGYAYAQTDPQGLTFGAELDRLGYRGESSARPVRIAGYLELHIEQGPVLEELGADIGVVEGIQGISWWRWRVTGHAGHAGTTPMDRRRDALVAAARCVLAMNRLPERIGGHLVTTVGVLRVLPGGINIIPDTVDFTLDARAPAAETLQATRAALQQIADDVAGQGLAVSHEETAYSEPTRFAPDLVGTIEAAAQDRGLRTYKMFSGAGHDAKYMADVAPTGMIFIPCRGGISHAEDELITWEAAAQGAQVLFDAVVARANQM